MSVKNISKSLSTIKDINPSQKTRWKRNLNWLTLPTTAGSCYALLAILPESNYTSIYISSTVYPCFINWGDGTTTTVNSAGTFNLTYDYSTFDPTNLTLITHDGLTYKQAVVQIYGNGNMTINFCQNQGRGSPSGSASANATSNWLDIQSNGQDVSNAGPTNVIISNAITNCYHTMLERVSIKNPKNTTFDTLFYQCNNLRQVEILGSTTTVTATTNMFDGCFLLEQAPSFNTANVTTMSGMFQGCYSLEQAPYYNTALVNDMNTMFSSCEALKTVPLYNTANVTNMSNMFLSCRSLEQVPYYNTIKVTNMSSMFSNCHSLINVPLYNTAIVTNMSSMFSNCHALESVPNFNTAVCTNASSMVNGCRELKTAPSFNFLSTAATNFTSMFAGCVSLVSIGNINTTYSTNMTTMFLNCFNLKTIPFLIINTANVNSLFQGCRSLAIIPALNFISGGLSSAFTTCGSLSSILATNINGAVNFSNCKLSKPALETIFNNLYPGALTITITTNPGIDTVRTTGTLSGSSDPVLTTNPTYLTTTNTSLVTVGMQLFSATATTTGVSVTFTDAGDLVTKTNHRLTNDTQVAFSAITTTTGISIRIIYYIINANTDTFQLSLTPSGSAIALTNNGTGTMKYRCKVINVVANTSITLDLPAGGVVSTSGNFRLLDTSIAVLKGWTVTG